MFLGAASNGLHCALGEDLENIVPDLVGRDARNRTVEQQGVA